MSYNNNNNISVSRDQMDLLSTAAALLGKFVSEAEGHTPPPQINTEAQDVRSRIEAKVFKNRGDEEKVAPVRSQGTDIHTFDGVQKICLWAGATTRSGENQGAWVIRAYEGDENNFTPLFTENGLAIGGPAKVMTYSILRAIQRAHELCPDARDVELFCTFGVCARAVNYLAARWREQNWTKNDGGPVHSAEHYREILEIKDNWSANLHCREEVIARQGAENENWLELPEKFRQEYQDLIGQSWNTLSRNIIGRIVDHRVE